MISEDGSEAYSRDTPGKIAAENSEQARPHSIPKYPLHEGRMKFMTVIPFDVPSLNKFCPHSGIEKCILECYYSCIR